ncbi:MAG: hypothetical protein IT246_08695 [Bacteroidia bacterium]|nr:hypothetical protein [Bacteroidia bacterium]MCZ2141338.1 hypothetical protein [Bacteroidia bacterium]
MKKLLYACIAFALATTVTLSSCKKEEEKKEEDKVETEKPTATEVCYKATGSMYVSNMPFTGFQCNAACTNYSDESNYWPNTFYTTIAFKNTSFTDRVMYFVFLGQEYPKSGTYKVADLTGMDGNNVKIASDEVIVYMVAAGTAGTKKSSNNTVTVTNTNGEIKVVSARIDLYDLNSGNASGIATKIDFTKTTTKN